MTKEEQIILCEQCEGTRYLPGGQRCPCQEEDDEAADRRAKMQVLRPHLPEVPRAMRHLPIDKRGFPVPWFVEWVNGEPEFRATSRAKLYRAIKERLCWVCGKELWREMVFVIGPMCSINKISSEAPSHRECAQFSARGCPFLSRPHMIRREDGTEGFNDKYAGIMVDRNPGVTLLWFTYRYEVVRVPAIPKADAREGILLQLGRAFKTEWYCKGRPATREEVMNSIETGLPLLREANRKQGIPDELGDAEIGRQLAEAMKLVPREVQA
jgi:hypothetical protein